MKPFVETHKRLYRHSMAINACLGVGTLHPRLKSDLGIAGRRMSRHFLVVNLYMTMRSLYKNDKYEADEHIPNFIYIRIHDCGVQWLVLYEFVGRQVRCGERCILEQTEPPEVLSP
jgi:hypothetical protein